MQKIGSLSYFLKVILRIWIQRSVILRGGSQMLMGIQEPMVT